jgi:uncharacterized protein HemX
MQPDGAAYSQSLRAAGTWIEQYFDPSSPKVAATLAEIESLGTISIDPVLPKIGAAGRLLQSVIRGSSNAP